MRSVILALLLLLCCTVALAEPLPAGIPPVADLRNFDPACAEVAVSWTRLGEAIDGPLDVNTFADGTETFAILNDNSDFEARGLERFT